MSQMGLSNFNWPTAAPGAPDIPNLPLSPPPAHSTVAFMTAFTLSLVSLPADTVIPPSSKPVHVTVTSTVLQDPATGTPLVSLIQQTKPLDFIAPVRPTKIVDPVPEMTVEAFEFYTPSVDASISSLAEATPKKSNSGPTPNVSQLDTPTTFASHNMGSRITGIVVGAVAFVLIIGLALAQWRARRSAAKAKESAPVDMEAVLKQKRERAEYLGMQRRSRRTRRSLERFQALRASVASREAAKTKGPVVDEVEGTTFEIQDPQVWHDRARRPSGLAMHPSTPVVSEHNQVRKGEGGENVGRAM
jgi:hypothetical protein